MQTHKHIFYRIMEDIDAAHQSWFLGIGIENIHESFVLLPFHFNHLVSFKSILSSDFQTSHSSIVYKCEHDKSKNRPELKIVCYLKESL